MLSDHIIRLDKKQADPDACVVCPKDPSHGAMGVHGSGAYLICTFRVDPATRKQCGAQVLVSVE